jgi:2-oxoglutarate ferredoxin oxidoreductase subunit alpha
VAKKVALMQGNEACAYGALYAGCTFFGGYPITPSTEVSEVLSKELPKIGGKFIQMEANWLIFQYHVPTAITDGGTG